MRRSLVFPLILSLGGCATLGESDYACKGRPGKPLCRSTTEVYEKTHDREALVKIEREDDEAEIPEKRSDVQSSPRQTLAPAPQIPVADPLPIRTPAKVMRIWIAPWEDKDGDLIVSGYVFTEIEPRRWQIGLTDINKTGRVLRPLATDSTAPQIQPVGKTASGGDYHRGSPGNRPKSQQPKGVTR